MKKILITGATGMLGGAVVDELIRKGIENVTVLVRDLSKAGKLKEKGLRIVKADYNDYESLLRAFKGIERLYFVSGNDIINREAQHENVVKAATEAKVGHIIYTSFQRKTESNDSPIAFAVKAHLHTEKLIRASGLTYTIMKHALYAESVLGFMGDRVLDTGLIFLPAGDGRASFTSRSDLASAGASVITGEGDQNKTYEISVNRSYGFSDIAAILSELSGKKVNYTSPDFETFSASMSKAGVPPEGIQSIAAFCQAIAMGEFDFPDPILEKLIGRKPRSLMELLKSAYKL